MVRWVFGKIDISSSYSITSLDGCVVNGWKDLFDIYKIEIGDKIIAMLHFGDAGPGLFFYTIEFKLWNVILYM